MYDTRNTMMDKLYFISQKQNVIIINRLSDHIVNEVVVYERLLHKTCQSIINK